MVPVWMRAFIENCLEEHCIALAELNVFFFSCKDCFLNNFKETKASQKAFSSCLKIYARVSANGEIRHALDNRLLTDIHCPLCAGTIFNTAEFEMHVLYDIYVSMHY